MWVFSIKIRYDMEENVLKLQKKIIAAALASIIGVSSLVCYAQGQQATASYETPSNNQSVSIAEEMSYSEYLSLHAKQDTDVKGFEINALDYISATAEVREETNLGTTKESGLYIGDSGEVSWSLNIEKSGLYRIGLYYYTVDGKESDIEKTLYIDGKIPYNQANSLTVSRVFASGEITRDVQGNDIYPEQTEIFDWYTQFYKDATGYYTDDLLFYLESGQHTLTLSSVKEPIVIGKIIFAPKNKLENYSEKLSQYKKNGLKEIELDKPIKTQAETPNLKSSTLLTPSYDRSSPNIEPYNGSKLSLNVMSADRFSSTGMWIEYNVEVPEDGLYNIALKCKQSEARGLRTGFIVYVNGEIPFSEAECFEFPYTSDYVNYYLGGDKPYYFYLKKGNNTIRFESTLGILGDYCNEVTESLNVLNDAYRRLIVLTGTNPDLYRDYSLQEKLPDVIETFGEQSVKLQEIAERLSKEFGSKSDTSAILESSALLLSKMYKKPSMIPSKLSNFSSTLSSLGTLINNMKRCGITMDYFYVTSENITLSKASTGFFTKLAYEIKNFFTSFVEDYDTFAVDSEGGKVISVWMSMGRDQANVLRQLINSEFTPKSGITVELRLADALLRATVAGQGPDVALSVGPGEPVNYAIRSAVYDLANFSDFDEVTERFSKSSLVPFRLDDACYALPETATFSVLFYRKDILDSLGLSVPKTWRDLYAILPVLQSNNMTVGLPVSDVTAGDSSGVQTFGSLLYQTGGSFYSEDSTKALFDTEYSCQAMDTWTQLYNNYGLPLSYNFLNRFTSGEMPIAMESYGVYNQLVIFAPQLKNKWDITLVPGTKKEDGTIDHTTPISVTGCMIMENAKNKEECWEFIKWWTSADAQTSFGREVECVIGEAGRYYTANIEAMGNIAWSTNHFNTLMNQFEWTVGIPQVPGGYYTWRNLDNAFREIINNDTDVREVMTDYNIIINEEIESKRKELLEE